MTSMTGCTWTSLPIWSFHGPRLVLTLLFAIACNGKKEGGSKEEVDPCGDVPWSQVSTGGYVACGVHTNGCVTCWGNDGFEDRGDRESGTPFDFTGDDKPPDETFSQVATVHDNFANYGSWSCGITTENDLVCWGDPELIQDLEKPARKIVVAQSSVCVVAVDGALQCWSDVLSSALTPPEKSFLDVDISDSTWGDWCGIDTTGQAFCWSAFTPDAEAHQQPPAGVWSSINLGQKIGCVLSAEGTVECWAWYESSPAPIPPGIPVTQIAVDDDVCGLQMDATLLCWGEDTSITDNVPEGTYVQVDVGAGYACAISTDGELVCWGGSGYGADEPPK